MAQPVQVSGLGYSGEFIVIDNSAAPAAATSNFTKEPLGYDTTAPGAVAQSTNAFSNGTIADAANPTVLQVSPRIVQKHSASSSGSVASLTNAFGSNNTLGNTVVVVCGVGNGTAPTVSDTLSNTYAQVVQVANSTALNVAIFVATNCKAGANTVTVTNGGSNASIASEVYEIQGLVTASNTAATDVITTNTSGSNAASPAVTVVPSQTNDFCFVALGLGTAAQTITVASPYNNDSGQLNPTTPAGLFSFVSASLCLVNTNSSSPSATAASAEPWAVAVATFKAASIVQTVKTGLIVLNPSQGPRIYFKNPA